jgi:hypothetical protein
MLTKPEILAKKRAKYQESKEVFKERNRQQYQKNREVRLAKQKAYYYKTAAPPKRPYKLTIENVKEFGKTRGYRLISTIYVNATTKLEWRCPKGHLCHIRIADLKSGRGCGTCGAKNRALNYPKNTVEWLRDIGAQKNCVLLCNTYTRSMDKYKWKCNKCSYKFDALPFNLRRYAIGCPRCAHYGPSTGQKKVYNFVKTYYPDALQEHPLERFKLDIFIPSLNKAIEYDGDYWHERQDAKSRDARKQISCKKSKIYLLRIKESEFKQNEELTLKKVLEFLNTATH